MQIQRRSENPPILTPRKDHLALYPFEDWQAIEADLAGKSDLIPEVQSYQRFVVANATECPIDSQGRILIPRHMRAHARLKGKVTIAGVLDKLEIWDTDLYEQDHRKTLERLPDIQLAVARSDRANES